MSFFGFGRTNSSGNVASPSGQSSDSQQLTSPTYDTGRNVDGMFLIVVFELIE